MPYPPWQSGEKASQEKVFQCIRNNTQDSKGTDYVEMSLPKKKYFKEASVTWNHACFFIDGLPDQSSEEANQNYF